MHLELNIFWLLLPVAALSGWWIGRSAQETKKLTENISKLNGEFKENPLVKNIIEFITKDKKRSICTPFS